MSLRVDRCYVCVRQSDGGAQRSGDCSSWWNCSRPWQQIFFAERLNWSCCFSFCLFSCLWSQMLPCIHIPLLCFIKAWFEASMVPAICMHASTHILLTYWVFTTFPQVPTYRVNWGEGSIYIMYTVGLSTDSIWLRFQYVFHSLKNWHVLWIELHWSHYILDYITILYYIKNGAEQKFLDVTSVAHGHSVHTLQRPSERTGETRTGI